MRSSTCATPPPETTRPGSRSDPTTSPPRRSYGFSRDGAALFLLSSAGVNASRLLRVRPRDRRVESVLAEDPSYDVAAVLTDPDTLEPQSVVFLEEREEWVHLDPALGAEIDSLRSRLRGEVGISRSVRTDRSWLVSDDAI